MTIVLNQKSPCRRTRGENDFLTIFFEFQNTKNGDFLRITKPPVTTNELTIYAWQIVERMTGAPKSKSFAVSRLVR